MSQNKSLICYAVAFIIAAGCFNAFGSYATKLTSAANKTVVEQSRIILVWAFFLGYSGEGHEHFSYIKLTGFLLIVLGVLFFN